jgi:hypothetical protein
MTGGPNEWLMGNSPASFDHLGNGGDRKIAGKRG